MVIMTLELWYIFKDYIVKSSMCFAKIAEMIDIVVEKFFVIEIIDLKGFVSWKCFKIWYAVALYVNYLFTKFQRNSPKKTSKNLTFMLTRSQNFESTRSLFTHA